MGSNVKVSSGGALNILSKVPWMLFVILFLIVAEYLQLSLDGPIGYSFITLAVVVLFIEMFKSGDISSVAFFNGSVLGHINDYFSHRFINLSDIC